jgi:hypothetical protein
MSNILNAHISQINNQIPARKLAQETGKRQIQAPQYLYQYSIDDALKEKEEFRKNVTLSQNKSLKKTNKSLYTKTGLFLAVITAYFIHKCK